MNYPAAELTGYPSESSSANHSSSQQAARYSGSRIAFASGAELETQLLLSKELRFISLEEFNIPNNLLIEVMKMLNKLIGKLSTKP